MKHTKYEEVKTLVVAKINVLLTGSAGSGKTTICKQLAEDLDLPFYPISMTRQTTVNYLIGFTSINGNYISTLVREAVEHGGILLLDEIDAADPNTLLCFNTLENGYMTFPDKTVEVHNDFRLVATANPFNEHNIYTGRSKLDASTLDRFDVVTIPRDTELEKNLVTLQAYLIANTCRELLSNASHSKTVSMRDCIRLDKRLAIGIGDDYYKHLLQHSEYLIEEYENPDTQKEEESAPTSAKFADITSIYNSLEAEHTTIKEKCRKAVKASFTGVVPDYSIKALMLSDGQSAYEVSYQGYTFTFTKEDL